MGETAKRVRVGINGFGRMGRLAFRGAFGSPEIDVAHINEIAGDASVGAHLLEFDSVYGRWAGHAISASDGRLRSTGSGSRTRLPVRRVRCPGGTPGPPGCP